MPIQRRGRPGRGALLADARGVASRAKGRVVNRIGPAITGWARTLPDFVIIGTQKGGTTSLYQYLVEHPRIAGARNDKKEVHFFDSNYQYGERWYRNHFPLKAERYARQARNEPFVTGEASPYYIFHPHAARRAHALVPHAKLILLLRNPVDRAYSQYHHGRRLGWEDLSFEDAVEREPDRLKGERERMLSDESYNSEAYWRYSYVARGVYVDQVAEWLRWYPRQQLLVLGSEDFYRDPAPEFRRVLGFLDVPHWERPEYPTLNSGEYSDMSPSTRQHLTEFFAPHNERLFELLGTRFAWEPQTARSRPQS